MLRNVEGVNEIATPKNLERGSKSSYFSGEGGHKNFPDMKVGKKLLICKFQFDQPPTAR